MKRDSDPSEPVAVTRSLEKFGADLRIARLKRCLTAEQVANSIEVHRSTYGRMENGDPGVAIGLYAKALYALGFSTPFYDLIDPRSDEEGQLFDLQRLPKRTRTKKHQPILFRLPNFSPIEARREGYVLRIGVLGVMSGPAAAWGLVSKYCAQATAEMYNEAGGVEIGGDRYRVEIACFDDRMDPALAAEGARRLTEQD